MATVPFGRVRERMMADPEFRKEYDALGEEYALIEAMIEARTPANMTQADVAKAMGVSQPRVARIESGKNVSLEWRLNTMGGALNAGVGRVLFQFATVHHPTVEAGEIVSAEVENLTSEGAADAEQAQA